MATGERREVHSAFAFKVVIGDSTSQAAYFRSVSGLKSETEAIPMQEGGVNEYEPKLVGLTKYPPLTLKRGLINNDWFKRRQDWVHGAPPGRFSITITQLGPGNKEVFSWSFHRAWISKWEGPDFDATKSEISVESLEIVHEGPLPGGSSGSDSGNSKGEESKAKKSKAKGGGGGKSTSASKARGAAKK